MDGGGAASPDFATSIPAPGAAGPIVAVAPAGIRVENCYVFKSRLQEYAQKVGLPTPEYNTLKEGPSHEPVFESTVVVNNTTYESLPGFFSRKAAEQSAAEVALMDIAMSAPVAQNRSIPAVQETGLCKNLLQEYAQKMNYAIPSYICTKQASGVAPFICTVEIGGIQYIGAAARTKKEAEIKAARTALLAIQGQSEGCANGAKKFIVVPGQRPVKEADKKPTETPKPLKVKKRGSRRKWNKKKFMGMADQIVDAEKDVEGLGMLLHYDYGEARRIEYELSRDTAMAQFNKEAIMMQPDEGDRIVQLEPLIDPANVQYNNEAIMMQPDEGDRIVQLEPPSDPANVQHNNEAIIMQSDEKDRILQLEPLRDPAKVQHNNEARSVGQDPLSKEDITVQPDGGDRIVQLESPRDPAMVQHNSEARSVEQDPLSKEAVMVQPGEGDRIVQPESPRDPAKVQHNNEARSVEEDPLSNAEVVMPNNEAITIEHRSVRAYVALRYNGDSTDGKEAPSNTSMTQGEELETTMHEASHTGEQVQPN